MDLFDINRNALIVKPSRAMIDWVNSVFPEESVPYDEIVQHDSADVYLIPEFEDIDAAQAWLRVNCGTILENTLEEWVIDESAWPDTLDFSLFEKFCDYSIQTMIMDTVDESYDDNYEDDDLSFEEIDDLDDDDD